MRIGESFCPGVLHAVPAKDGMLMRIRMPGGFISAQQLSVIADASDSFADGQIEITSRANLQLRAIKKQDLPSMVETLTLAGLVPSPRHDRVRNIVTSPLAGLDPDELVDTHLLVEELDRRLRSDPIFAGLHPKFSFGLDGGGARFNRETDDLTLRALIVRDALHFGLMIAGVDSGFMVAPENAVDLLLSMASCCLSLAKRSSVPARGKAIMALPNGFDSLLQASSPILIPCPYPEVIKAVSPVPLGIYRGKEAGHAHIVPSVPLGRLTSKQARSVAEASLEFRADLRLASWRGLVLGAISESLVADIASQLETAGVSCDGRDGFRGLAACAGSVGCEASFADVRGEATALARHLAGRESAAGWTVNFSGCEKRCAMRNGATAELVAHASGYSLHLHGQLVCESSTMESARSNILAAHAALLSGVAS